MSMKGFGKQHVRRPSKRFMVAVIFLALVVGGSYAWYGLSVRPVVDYTFGGPSDIRRSYQLTALTRTQPGTIDITHILIQNSGQSDISVVVTLHATNSVVSANYYGPFNDMANVQIELPVNSGYRVVTFYLTLLNQTSTFSIRADVNRVLDYSSLTSSIATNFADIQPTTPTSLVYTSNSTTPTDYQLAQQS
ncbi:MAG TPA: hypothetical protein VLV31_04360 [Candidatus Acidoferrales bacterium]|nr:hypothetical protein [Candidatus Acidoferrales bacterium]